MDDVLQVLGIELEPVRLRTEKRAAVALGGDDYATLVVAVVLTALILGVALGGGRFEWGGASNSPAKCQWAIRGAERMGL